jgi:hypothetical protein
VWQKQVTDILQVGRLLIQAKEELDSEAFKQLKLPFGERTAQALRRIAAHPVLSDAKHASLLPPCWATLDRLARLNHKVLRDRLADGKINPGLQRHQVRTEVEGLPPREKRERKDSTPAAELKDRRAALAGMSLTELVEALPQALLAELADVIIAQQIALAPVSETAGDIRTTLTKIFRSAVCATTPGELDVALTAFTRKCAANNINPKDLLITFPKTRAKKR